MDQFLIIIRHSLDILLIWIALFALLRFLKGTRAMNVLYGLLVLGVIYLIAKIVQLQAFTELVNRLAGVLLIIVVIVFQPEIRRGLGNLGVFTPLYRVFPVHKDMIEEIVKACFQMASQRTGALIVLTRQAGLKGITEKKLHLNADVKAELLQTIFNQYSPIHDGAVIITDNRIIAAGCYLPLTDKELPHEYGTRHRAAIGITEESDAVAIVVSEERGKVSLAVGGEILRDMTQDQLNRQLTSLLAGMREEG